MENVNVEGFVVFLGLNKAVEILLHKILLKKFEEYGIRGKVLKILTANCPVEIKE